MADQAKTLRRRDDSKVVPLYTTRKRVVAVSGGKGGVGKSTLAVNLAVAYGAAGSKTLLVDGDLGMADLNLLMGRAPERSLVDLLRGLPAKDVLVEAHGIQLLPALNGSYQLANLDDTMRRHLTRIVARLALDFETLVLDTAAGIHQSTVELTAMASEVMLVATPEPLSLADAYASLKVLSIRERRTRVYIVPNNVRSADEANAVISQLTKLSDRFLGVQLVALPAIPHDPQVPFAAAEGVPLVVTRPDCPAARAMRRVARTLDELALKDDASRLARERIEALANEGTEQP